MTEPAFIQFDSPIKILNPDTSNNNFLAHVGHVASVKQHLDAKIAAINATRHKNSCRLAPAATDGTDGSINLAGTIPTTLDGKTIADGDDIFLPYQATASQVGAYRATVSGGAPTADAYDVGVPYDYRDVVASDGSSGTTLGDLYFSNNGNNTGVALGTASWRLLTWRGTWDANTDYAQWDLVKDGNNYFMGFMDPTTGTTTNDASKWLQVPGIGSHGLTDGVSVTLARAPWFDGTAADDDTHPIDGLARPGETIDIFDGDTRKGFVFMLTGTTTGAGGTFDIGTDAIGATLTNLQGPQGQQGETGPQGDQGNQGNQGNQGIQGTQGIQGEQGIQGAVGLTGQGVWAVETAYVARDLVTRLGSGYYAVQPSTGVDPATDDGTNWQLLVSKGSTGAQGNQGDQGIQGIQGEQGIQGTSGVIAAGQGSNGAQWTGGTTYQVNHGKDCQLGKLLFFTKDGGNVATEVIEPYTLDDANNFSVTPGSTYAQGTLFWAFQPFSTGV